MMNFKFVFFIPWILFLNVRRCWSILCVLFVLSLWSTICASETTEPMSDEFLLKNAKVIEAVPHVLRRVHSSIVPEGKQIFFFSIAFLISDVLNSYPFDYCDLLLSSFTDVMFQSALIIFKCPSSLKTQL